jgi:1-aminocyclopropane-1-carboxylate deaminase/D-cysteine desulfhydrase-like pyridoxal-dependent ACC family enzyme
MSNSYSPITKVNLCGRNIYIKRDDLLALPGVDDIELQPFMNGNKARKLKMLFNMNPFPESIASYGGIQSNSMVALAALCKLKSSTFHYFATDIPRFLQTTPYGNFKTSLDMDMQLHTITRQELALLDNCVVLTSEALSLIKVNTTTSYLLMCSLRNIVYDRSPMLKLPFIGSREVRICLRQQ